MMTGTNAVLNGFATANEPEATAWFEWRMSAGAWSRGEDINVAGGDSVVFVTNRISDLVAGAVYNFRLVVSNRTGVAYGADQVLASGNRVVAWGAVYETNLTANVSNVVGVAIGMQPLFLQGDGTVRLWGSGELLTTQSVAVACGEYHYMTLQEDGRVKCLGYYNGTNVPAELSNVVAIAAGNSNSLALKSDGTVVAWGDNRYGQTNVPVGLSNIVAIAGGDHSLAVKNDGTVVAWGENTYGQGVAPANLTNVVAVAVGGHQSLALKADGTVVAWGDYYYGQPEVPANLSNVVAVATDWSHRLALKRDGNVVAWGNIWDGQTDVPAGMSNVVGIAAGLGKSMALLVDGQPHAFEQTVIGYANSALTIQLTAEDPYGHPLSFEILELPASGSLYQYSASGTGEPIVSPHTIVTDPEGRVIFVPAAGTSGVPYASFQFFADNGRLSSRPAGISIGISAPKTPFATTLAATRVKESSAVLCGFATANDVSATAWFEWGPSTAYANRSQSMSVGAGDAVVFLTNQITGLVAGRTYHYRLVASNRLGVIYGADQRFAFGKKVVGWAYNSYGQATAPVGLSNVVAVAGGSSHTVALKSDETVVAWGNNGAGQTNVPPGLSNVVALACGGYHSVALQSDGRVVAWGDNGFGQGTVPVGFSNAVAVAGGFSHTLALQSNGRVVAWGYNIVGQTDVPAGLSNAVAVAAGGHHNLVLKNDGTVVAWGNNYAFQTNVPAGLSNVVAVAAGISHCLALKSDGTVVAWGYDASTNVSAGLSNVVAVASGGHHCLALKSDGTVVAWGVNSSGQTNVPACLSNVVAVAGGEFFSLALGMTGPPFAETLPATDIGLNSATLKGAVTANLLATGAWYEWGTNTAYGNSSAFINVGDSNSPTALGLTLSGLQPGVMYHYRLGATNAASLVPSYGADMSFTVPIMLPLRIGKDLLGSGAVQIGFAGVPGALFSAWGSTNLADWERIGAAIEVSPGNFYFEDREDRPSRFYHVRSP